jgi:hypothetical protein
MEAMRRARRYLEIALSVTNVAVLFCWFGDVEGLFSSFCFILVSKHS